MGEVEFWVMARDEFGRGFYSVERVPQTWVDTARVDVAAVLFPRLVRDILRLMGTGASATWSGSTRIPVEWAIADEQ